MMNEYQFHLEKMMMRFQGGGVPEKDCHRTAIADSENTTEELEEKLVKHFVCFGKDFHPTLSIMENHRENRGISEIES